MVNRGNIRTKRRRRTQNGGRNKYKTRRDFQIGGGVIKPIMGNLLYILEKETIEYLPSSKLMGLDMKHYLEMVDYHKLENIIDNNPEYKKSPTIQELFNYDSIEVNRNNGIDINTKRIRCEDLLEDTHRTYYLRSLFFYLLECNIQRSFMRGGGEKTNPVMPDGGPKPPVPDGEPKPPVPSGGPKPAVPGGEPKPPVPDGRPKPSVPDKPIDDKIKYSLPGNKSKNPEESREINDIDSKNEEIINIDEIDIVPQKDIPGYKEYEKIRDTFENDDNMEQGQKVSLTAGNFIIYNVNWFNVCLGIDEMDIDYENQYLNELNKIGLTINKEKLNDKINELLEDNSMRNSLRSAIHSRLLECSKKPQTMMDRIRKRISFKSCIECDLKDKGSILYLYDEYKAIINKNTTKLNRIDLTIILVVCEIRQRLLSYYISLEILRRNNTTNRVVNKLIKKIFNNDLPLIKKMDDEINQKRIRNNEIMRMEYEEQKKLIDKQKKVIKNNQNIREIFDENKRLDEDQMKELTELFESNDLDNEDFIERMNAELDNDQPSLIGGGNIVEASEILQKKREPNLLSEVYDINDNVISGKCDNMRNMNNVTLDGLQYMNHC